MSLDPAKVIVQKDIEKPKNKDELLSFICMMQSNAEFIPSFAKEVSFLRNLIKANKKFTWLKEHDYAFKISYQNLEKDY